MIKKWETKQISNSHNYKIFSVNTIERMSPRTGKKQDFYTITSKNWINVIAITPDDNVVCIEQYRHGSDKVELEIPGGTFNIDNEDPQLAALRELKEETGYSANRAIELGCVNPNPALFGNKCYTFLVPYAKLTDKQNLEEMEDIGIKLIPLKKVLKLIKLGKITHGLVVAAFYFYELYGYKK